MNIFLKIVFLVVWTIVVAICGCSIGAKNKGVPKIFTPPLPPSKYELLLNRQALTVKDEKGDSYILKKTPRGTYTSNQSYDIFPATEAEMQSEKSK
jgi:hypothetical protein